MAAFGPSRPRGIADWGAQGSVWTAQEGDSLSKVIAMESWDVLPSQQGQVTQCGHSSCHYGVSSCFGCFDYSVAVAGRAVGILLTVPLR
mmetsp:Transcript_84764/g.220740  ORF Transcript_84764/g.220740 Transcript_84764/m.220740 type:complete len:89 (+) Transcript_84764:161-427(+)